MLFQCLFSSLFQWKKHDSLLSSLDRKKPVILNSLGSVQQEEVCVSAVTGCYKKFIRGHWAIQITLYIYGKRNLQCWQQSKEPQTLGKLFSAFSSTAVTRKQLVYFMNSCQNSVPETCTASKWSRLDEILKQMHKSAVARLQ